MAGEVTSLQAKAYGALKKMRGLGIVLSIIIILLGICMFIRPIATGAAMVWVLVIGTLIDGIRRIIQYCKMPKGARDGFLLAGGIILIIASIILIANGFHYSFQTTVSIEGCIAIMIGVIALFTGIGKICNSGMIKANGGSQGMAIFAGIIEIIFGCLILSAPITGIFVLTIAFGLYLVVTGIAMLISFIALK